MAYKDEYEVARLYTDGAFAAQLARTFDGTPQLAFHLAPPLFARRDPVTGELRKRKYGAWMLRAMRVLARTKGLRGTRLDPFGRTPERRAERQAIADFERTLDRLAADLDASNYALAVAIAQLPAMVRGFGHVKDRNRADYEKKLAALLAQFRRDLPVAQAAD